MCARAAGAAGATLPSRESRVTLDGRRGRQEVEGAGVAGSRRAHKQNEATQRGEVNRRCFPSAAAAMAATAPGNRNRRLANMCVTNVTS